jgi:omega-6 fatty acid desaturase (delta-12 desaturase)
MNLRARTRQFAQTDARRASKILVESLIIHLGSLFLAVMTSDIWPVCLAFIATAAFSAVRLFVIQHDCGHQSYFAGRHLNILVGRTLSILTLVPFDSWVMNHNQHHAHVGSLEHPTAGNEILTLTVSQYVKKGLFGRLSYRIYRNPWFLFGIAPFIMFVVFLRWPVNAVRAGVKSLMIHDALVVAYMGLLFLLGGWTAIIIFSLSFAIASSIGVIIFYLQHNFEETYWESQNWDFQTAALAGSSVLDFGRVFDWWTLNIAYHDMHHLNSRIPSYQLKACFDEFKHELAPTKIGPRQALECCRMRLWDENLKIMVPFPSH